MSAITAANANRTFLDSPALLAYFRKKGEAALKRFGAFVRQRDKTLVKQGDGISAPGAPPSSHKLFARTGPGDIFFAADRASVVIGPQKLDKSTAIPTAGTIASVIEAGGSEVLIKRIGQKATERLATFRPRPHTKPAFDYVIAHEMKKVWQG